MRKTVVVSLVTLALAAAAVTAASPASAIEVVPGPSVVTDQLALTPTLPEVEGFDELAVPGIWLGIKPEALPVSLNGFTTEMFPGTHYVSSQGLNVSVPPPDDDAGCACYGHNQMKWKDYGGYESVRIGFSQNEAQWVWPRQDHHAALLHSGGRSCDYSGEYSATFESGPIYDKQNSGAFSTGWHTQWNNTWTLASGHHWFSSDGTEWSVNGEADICKKF